jgi:6-pyruvoyltetrahydropterin/6-carboxytetrahydropterin synthase
MYILTVRDHFDAAHSLRGYDGECQRLHGHTWDVEVTVEGTELDAIGIVYDFKTLKTDLTSVLGDYDHQHLNEVPPFDAMNATAENLARVVYQRLTSLVAPCVKVTEVAVWESPIARVAYRPDGV